MRFVIKQGDCSRVLASISEGSVEEICCDPPYGLEFMGAAWDRIVPTWEAGGGFSKPGIGQRQTEWPSFSSTSRFGTANPTCAECGGRLRGTKKCTCSQPHDHWKPIGKRRNVENEGLPDNHTRLHLDRLTAWHEGWLAEAFRVLVPGGRLAAFGGTRVFHRLSAAMENVGFIEIGLETWSYGSGFPKSYSIGKGLDKMLGVARTEVIRAGKAGAAFHYGNPGEGGFGTIAGREGGRPSSSWLVLAPATPEAAEWEAWGTAQKPAWEPVVVGRKPAC